MSSNREKKQQQINEIKKQIQESYGVVVWDFQGLSAKEISGLKRLIRDNDGIDTVYKNRIIKIAFEDLNKPEIGEFLKGTSSFLFLKNKDSKSLKELYNFIKKQKNKKITLKAGYINDEFYDTVGINEIASLPSKEELLSMLLVALQGNMKNFAFVLSEVNKQKTN